MQQKFDIQDNILKKKTATEEETKNVIKLRKELDNYNKSLDDFENSDLRKGKTTTSQMLGGFPVKTTTKDETTGERADALIKMRSIRDAIDQQLTSAIHDQTIAQSIFNGELDKTTLTYEQMFRLVSEGIAANSAVIADADDLEKQRQKDELERIKNKFDLIKFNNSLIGQNSAELREQFKSLEHAVFFNRALVDAGLDYNTELDHSINKLSSLQDQLDKMDLFIEIKTGFKIPDMGGARDTVIENAENLVNVLQPFTDAAADLWMAILTPPDPTLSKEEQKEKTQMMFAGVFTGLGQALFSIGLGIVLFNKGLQSLTTPQGIAMMAAGSGLIALGKSKAQKVKNSASSRSAGGGANGGSGVGGFSDMMGAIQGEQVFRLAGNDLVTAINRTNTFQGTIGG